MPQLGDDPTRFMRAATSPGTSACRHAITTPYPVALPTLPGVLAPLCVLFLRCCTLAHTAQQLERVPPQPQLFPAPSTASQCAPIPPASSLLHLPAEPIIFLPHCSRHSGRWSMSQHVNRSDSASPRPLTQLPAASCLRAAASHPSLPPRRHPHPSPHCCHDAHFGRQSGPPRLHPRLPPPPRPPWHAPTLLPRSAQTKVRVQGERRKT